MAAPDGLDFAAKDCAAMNTPGGSPREGRLAVHRSLRRQKNVMQANSAEGTI
jgi:hypothetical protein